MKKALQLVVNQVWHKQILSLPTCDQRLELNMLIRNAFASLGMVAFLAVAMLGVGEARAQDTAGGWQAERAQIQADIKKKIDGILAQKVNKQKIATALRFPWPVPEPTASKAEIVKRVTAEVDKLASEKFPESKREEFKKQAAEEFRVYQPGDEVPEFTLDRPGAHLVVQKGRLLQVTENRIRVGSRWLIPEDLPAHMKARFYEEDSQREIKLYINRKNFEYNQEIERFKRDEMKKRLPLAFLAAGYAPQGSKKAKSTDAEDWLPRGEVVDRIYEAYRQQLTRQIGPKITKDAFTAKGYELVKENGQWMPQAEAAAFRAKLAAEEAARKAQAGPELDIFGGGEMMNEGQNSGSAKPKTSAAEEGFFDEP
jgi:hypothetical protein